MTEGVLYCECLLFLGLLLCQVFLAESVLHECVLAHCLFVPRFGQRRLLWHTAELLLALCLKLNCPHCCAMQSALWLRVYCMCAC